MTKAPNLDVTDVEAAEFEVARTLDDLAAAKAAYNAASEERDRAVIRVSERSRSLDLARERFDVSLDELMRMKIAIYQRRAADPRHDPD